MGQLYVTLIFSVLLVSSLVGNVESYMVGNNPHHLRESLDPQDRYHLEWLVNWSIKQITFNVTARTTGYVGFGLSPNGKMTGADIIIGGVDSKGRTYFADYHAVGRQTPVRDPSQDYILHHASQNRTHTFLSFSRPFDTCDPQDFAITEDKVSILWAFGSSDKIRYHHENRGIFHTYLVNPDYSPQILTEPGTGVQTVLDQSGNIDYSTKVWSIHREMELPAQETLYWCTIHKTPRLRRKNHVIGFNVRLHDDLSLNHVHHMAVARCNPPRGGSQSAFSMFDQYAGGAGGDCLTLGEPIESETLPIPYCTQFNHVWAVGGRVHFQPPHVGLPFHSEEYYLIQVHLDNPNLLRNSRVNMSIDFFYTENLRKYEGGLINVRHKIPGLPPSLLMPPRSNEHQIRAICGAECTNNMIPPEGILVYGVMLHTHVAGRKMRVRHFRNNRELPFLISDENYSFAYQQARNLPREVRVLPGDQLVAECVYESGNETVLGGFSTRQEMCLMNLFEYKRLTDILFCESEIVSADDRVHFLAGVENITWSQDQLNFVVDKPHPLAGVTIQNVSDKHVDWTPERRRQLERSHLYRKHVNTCLPEFWTQAPGSVDQSILDGVPVSYPYGATPYQPDEVCSSKNKH